MGWSRTLPSPPVEISSADALVTVTGTISQWGEVSKPKKERTRPKAKADIFTTTTGESVPAGALRNARGGRGRGGARGKSTHATTNGTRTKDTQPLSVPTAEASEWNTKPTVESTAGGESAAAETTPAPAPASSAAPAAPKPATIAEGAKTTWASMLRQSTTPKVAPKPKEIPTKAAPEPTMETLPAAETTEPEPEAPAPAEEPAPEPEKETAPAPSTESVAPAVPVVPAVPAIPSVAVPEIALVPSKDQLTEKNLDQVKDDSHPPRD